MIALVAEVIVLLVAFGYVVATSLPIVTALTAILMDNSIIGILSDLIAVPKVATIISLMLGLEDGHRLCIARPVPTPREPRARACPCHRPPVHANATTGLSVLFAGVTVVVTIAGMQISGIPMLAVMGWASALMVTVTMLAALHSSPRTARAGRATGEQPSNAIHPHAVRADDPGSRAAHWAAFVVRKPVGIGIAAVLVLLP